MNLHAIVGPIIGAVNPPILGTIKSSTGYSTAADGTRTSTYTTTAGVSLQVQALSAKDLAHLDSLNIQNVTRKVWINSSVQGVNRATGKGGDLLIFGGQTWLVTIVFETWDADGPWSSVGVTEQNGA
jgi:hypothetical protein